MDTPLRRSSRLSGKTVSDDFHSFTETPRAKRKQRKASELTEVRNETEKIVLASESEADTRMTIEKQNDDHQDLVNAMKDLSSPTTRSSDSDVKPVLSSSLVFSGPLIEPVSTLPPYFYMPPCLCTISDVPAWQAQLAGINNGYRMCDNFYDAFMSLFYWHNESMNMWIHYVGTGFLAIRAHHYSNLIWEQSTSSSHPTMEKTFLVVCILMGQVFPILLSALCHHFYCVSKVWHRRFWYLDFFGILSGITWGALSFLYLAFYSNTLLMSTFMIIVISGHLFALYYCWNRFKKRTSIDPLQPRDRMPEFSFVLSTFSALCYTSTVIPTLYFHGKDYFNHADLFEVATKSCMYPAGMALGIVVFAQGHIPERFTGLLGLPDHFFDYFGHSHQLWHVVSFTLLYLWIEIIYKHYHARMDITGM